MIIRDKPQKKNKKLLIDLCSVCGIQFGHYISRTKNCSKDCARISFSRKMRNGGQKKCSTCNKEFYARKSYLYGEHKKRFCSESCRISGKKSKLPKYLTLSHDGYIMMTRTPDGRKNVRQHRYLMEKHLGRKLLANESVHHKNEDKRDNRLSNLIVMTPEEHAKYHGEQRRSGSKLTPEKVKHILKRIMSGKEYAEMYGVSVSTIESVWQRKNWRSVTL